MKAKLRSWNVAVLSVAALAASVSAAAASSGGQGAFVSGLWEEAKARGIPRPLFSEAFADFSVSTRVMELTKKQPEAVSTVQDYVQKRVSASRVEAGRGKLREFSGSLQGIAQAYGVPPELLVSIWGIETSYGAFVGGNNVVHALATLGHEGYRADYFRGELMTALEIVRDGHIGSKQMIGSWAGAMGQTQFMPSSFKAYAVDFEGDGRVDIWRSVPDALASSANYLRKNGWRHGEAWGYEVTLPPTFDFGRASAASRLSLAEWQAMGLARADGKRFPRPSDPARFYLPAGGTGPAFLLLPNFDVIKRYNNSDSYALAVAHLADRLGGGEPFATKWPDGVLPLTAEERRELQLLLAGRGLYEGDADGRIGPQTRAAIIQFQQQAGMRADAFPTKRLLQMLRARDQNAALDGGRE